MFADWNLYKGGSDILFKFASIAELFPALNLIQAQVTGMLLMNYSFASHQLNHIATAKDGLEPSYSSIHHFQNAKNKRSTLKDTCFVLTERFLKALL